MPFILVTNFDGQAILIRWENIDSIVPSSFNEIGCWRITWRGARGTESAYIKEAPAEVIARVYQAMKQAV